MARRITNYYADGASAPSTPSATPQEQLSRRLIAQMRKKGWTQSELARQASVFHPTGNIDRQKISNYIRQANMPEQRTLEAIARALEVEPHELASSEGVAWHGLSTGVAAPIVAPQPASASLAAGEMSMAFEDGQVRLRVDRMVSPDIAIKVMAMLTAGVAN